MLNRNIFSSFYIARVSKDDRKLIKTHAYADQQSCQQTKHLCRKMIMQIIERKFKPLVRNYSSWFYLNRKF